MDDETHWDGLLGRIYLSPLDREARDSLPSALAKLVGGVQAAFWTLDPRTGMPDSPMVTNLPSETEPLYRSYYHRIDPWRTAINALQLDTVQLGTELIADAALRRTEYYADFGRRIETFHLIGACVAIGRDPSSPVGRVSIIRPQGMEGFAAGESARLRRLLPHLRRAWQTGQQLARGGDTAAPAWTAGISAMLQALQAAAIATDGHGRVLVTNAESERLDAVGALRLRGAVPQRLLTLPEERATGTLRAAIGNAARGGAGMEAVLELGPAGQCRVTVSPLSRLVAGPGLALVVVTPEAVSTSEKTLRRAQQLFGFTRTEAEVALALAAGSSPKEIAEMRGVQISTVRSQLLRALDKAEAGDLRGLAIRLTLLRG
ncbi:helix-turn-helix transcriptional regulator [Roseomonas populi]|uniref:HTH luxR-type domain-containing protein n=1 Tax=Roseomonas populi TaxID=3121582 RepID=A0ABT1X9E6_9PROT|nr:hypothetical protein [Roseomonas pecuniae]MCR0984720.1 hypothetical protein [Roseomonas pecuniae]